MRRFRFLYIFLITVGLCFGCSPGTTAPGFSTNVENVIFVVVDTLRANHCGFMGYERETTPVFDKFSERCVVFDNAWCTRALTLPSFTSLWTGLHTINNGIFQNAWPLADDIHLLVEDFRDAGFATIGAPASDIMAPRHGIARGFDVYDMPKDPPRWAPDEIDVAVREIEKAEEPVFVFIHFWEPHSPYEPEPEVLELFGDPDYEGPMDGSVEVMNKYNLFEIEFGPEDIRRGVDLYDAEVRGLDNHLERLFDFFETSGLIDNSLIVVTADHGESLGEGHVFQHFRDTNVELHIPLMFHFPNDFGAGERFDVLVENTDIMPTVMEILGMDIPEGIDGKSLLPVMKGEETVHRTELLSVGTKHEDLYLYSKFDGERRWRVDVPVMPETHHLDEKTLERLRSLGYIGN